MYDELLIPTNSPFLTFGSSSCCGSKLPTLFSKEESNEPSNYESISRFGPGSNLDGLGYIVKSKLALFQA